MAQSDNQLIPMSVVDNLGSDRQGASIAVGIAEATSRFRVRLTPAECEDQQARRVKLLAQLSLLPFQPRTEQEFEDWVDLSAKQITKHQINAALFQDAWEAAATPTYARRIGSIPVLANHEELVNAVAG